MEILDRGRLGHVKQAFATRRVPTRVDLRPWAGAGGRKVRAQLTSSPRSAYRWGTTIGFAESALIAAAERQD